MAKTRLIVELGTGVDLHGGDYTKAATRAVEDAIHRSSLLYLADIMKADSRPKIYIDVTIASPKPDAVNGDEVLKALPFGEKTIKVLAGGMLVDRSEPDNIIISNAAVLVSVET